MSEEEKKNTEGLSRREFLKDAGLVVGGATVGSMAILSACSGGTTVTQTTTKTVTTTAAGAGTTTTVTSPPTTVTVSKFIDPLDGTEYPTLDALKAHFASAHPGASLPAYSTLNVNGIDYKLVLKDHWSLAMTLREQLGLFATKLGCDMGQCGCCTVLKDGVPILACVLLACEVGSAKIETLESLSDGIKLSPLQQKFADQQAFQCGYCTPGFIMAAQGLLKVTPKPTADEVRLALSGHLCMCQNFKKTVEAVTGGV